MEGHHKMSLMPWIYAQHPFFQSLKADLKQVLARDLPTSLDELVCMSRRPVRTVLLGLRALEEHHEATIEKGLITLLRPHVPPPVRLHSERYDTSPIDSTIAERYCELAQCREAPALLWSQRRLTPNSAVERAAYIVRKCRSETPTIVFLGDDDLVSPIVAAALPRALIHVFDIDAAVLEKATDTASALGASLQTDHADLSKAVLTLKGRADVTVSDPFPSGDGSFEMMFWGQVAHILKIGGISISTIGASHKPVGFDAAALRVQQSLGLALLDLRDSFGRYETFPFEFSTWEENYMKSRQLLSRVSQTKSLMTSQKLTEAVAHEASAPFDFDEWSAATESHYLTIQAGTDAQKTLASERGTAAVARAEFDHERHEKDQGFDTMALFHLLSPDQTVWSQESGVELLSHSQAKTPTALVKELIRQFALPVSDAEVTELERLSASATVSTDYSLAEIGLAVRALESWERMKLM